MRKGIAGCFMLFVYAVPAWAVDDATIKVLQNDVANSKMKSDDQENKIKNLEGNLPAERAARIAADEALQNQINGI